MLNKFRMCQEYVWDLFKAREANLIELNLKGGGYSIKSQPIVQK